MSIGGALGCSRRYTSMFLWGPGSFCRASFIVQVTQAGSFVKMSPVFGNPTCFAVPANRAKSKWALWQTARPPTEPHVLQERAYPGEALSGVHAFFDEGRVGDAVHIERPTLAWNGGLPIFTMLSYGGARVVEENDGDLNDLPFKTCGLGVWYCCC